MRIANNEDPLVLASCPSAHERARSSERSDALPSEHQPVYEHDHGKHEQHMDQAAHHGAKTDVADEPSHDEEYDDDVEQVVHDDQVF